uniref:NADH:ubiquinone oxidoreductase complex assembly factor 2 n=1 Tax=Pelusios castaneus TaxID=367368 RepID=A0A8C8S3T7_9SAUR
MALAWRFLRALRLRVLGPEKQHVGSDQFGNQYFRIPEHQSWAGQNIRERRFAECVDQKEYNYEVGDIPTEWEAWLRKRRQDPPTMEELLKNEKYREEMKQKVIEASEKDRLLQTKEYKTGLVAEPIQTQIKGHASAPYYGKDEPSPDPTSSAKTFQPGSWIPPDKQQP